MGVSDSLCERGSCCRFPDPGYYLYCRKQRWPHLGRDCRGGVRRNFGGVLTGLSACCRIRAKPARRKT
ncbi:protein of unknown function [Rhodovastum atsumiense]|nr:protein of unknown function [Rhodovastum atsumiense]